MAFPTGTYTGYTGASGDLDVFIPTVWGSKINDFFKEELILGDFFTNRSDELAGGGDTLKTPGLTAMTAYAKSNATGVTLNSPTETAATLTVQTWKEVSFMIEDMQAAIVKKSYVLQQNLAQNAAYTVAKGLEVSLAVLFSTFTTSVGASTTNLADSEILTAIATLEGSAVPGIFSGQVAFFFHPNTFWRQVQALDKFSLAVNSPSNDPTAKKPKGMLYGIPVYTSPNIQYVSGTSGRSNALAHKDAIHWAAAPLPQTGKSYNGINGVRVQTNYIPEYLGFLTTADFLYGSVLNRAAAGIWMMTHATKA